MYDVIIVGARVAGAATALLLARRGLKVVAMERAAFPSDTLSTHQVQVPAIARLARWGVLDPIMSAGTPPTRDILFAPTEDVEVRGRMPTVEGIDFMCSPRRTLLDTVLVEAARRAGAEIRENVIVEELVVDGERVVGVRGREKSGGTFGERATVVVGADGRHSAVAKWVGARAYRATPTLSMGSYTYWADVPAAGGELRGAPGYASGMWPTNDGLVMTYLAWPIARFGEYRRDVEGNFLASMDAVGFGERLRAGRRVERIRTTPDLPSWIRVPYGPGWALVGDAGLAMDPITGQGIADAFRDAELLADALVDGLGGGRVAHALRKYQRERDRTATPMYKFTAELAALHPPIPAERALFAAMAERPREAARFFAVFSGAAPVHEFHSPRAVIRLIGLRGFAQFARHQMRRQEPVATPEGALVR